MMESRTPSEKGQRFASTTTRRRRESHRAMKKEACCRRWIGKGFVVVCIGVSFSTCLHPAANTYHVADRRGSECESGKPHHASRRTHLHLGRTMRGWLTRCGGSSTGRPVATHVGSNDQCGVGKCCCRQCGELKIRASPEKPRRDPSVQDLDRATQAPESKPKKKNTHPQLAKRSNLLFPLRNGGRQSSIYSS